MQDRLHAQMSATTNITRLKRVLVASGWLLLVVGLAVYLFEFAKLFYTTRSMDYWWYSYGFHAIFSSPGSVHLYDVRLQRAWVSAFGKPRPYDEYVYPPQFAFLFSWLSIFSVRLGEAIWAGLSISTYMVSLFLLQKLAYRGAKKSVRLFLFALGVFALPYLSDTINANSDWLLFFLLTMAFSMLYDKQRPLSSGIFLGIAVVCKVTPIVVLLYFVFRREWMVAFSGFLTAAVVTFVTVLFTGLSPFIDYVTKFFSFTDTSMKNGVAPWNSSFLGLLQYWSGQDSAQVNQATLHIAVGSVRLGTYNANTLFDIYLLVIGSVFIAIAYGLRKNLDKRYDMALASLSLVLFSPLVELHYLLFLVITVLMLFGMIRESQDSNTKDKKSINKTSLVSKRVVIGTLIAIYTMIEDVMNPLHGVISMIGLLLLTIATACVLSNSELRPDVHTK